jgi:hypothetical protein
MFQLKAEDRLRSWREFRAHIDLLPLNVAIAQVAQLWTTAPFTPYHLDSNPNNWPDPWTLIEENYYCDIAKCLGIMYTISLTQHKKNLNIEYRMYRDNLGHEYNLSWINQGKYILNLIDGEVVNIEQFDKTLELTNRYLEEELKLDSY